MAKKAQTPEEEQGLTAKDLELFNAAENAPSAAAAQHKKIEEAHEQWHAEQMKLSQGIEADAKKRIAETAEHNAKAVAESEKSSSSEAADDKKE